MILKTAGTSSGNQPSLLSEMHPMQVYGGMMVNKKWGLYECSSNILNKNVDYSITIFYVCKLFHWA